MHPLTRLGVAALSLTTLSLGASGCYAHHGYVEPDPVGICLLGACLGYNIAQSEHVVVDTPPPPEQRFYPLHTHDGHFHGPECGCPSRFTNGRRVWWYAGRWEFYDGREWWALEGAAGPSW